MEDNNYSISPKKSYGWRLGSEFKIQDNTDKFVKNPFSESYVEDKNLMESLPEGENDMFSSPIFSCKSSPKKSYAENVSVIKDSPVTVKFFGEKQTVEISPKEKFTNKASKLNLLIRRVYDNIARGEELDVKGNLSEIVKKDDYFMQTVEANRNYSDRVAGLRRTLRVEPMKKCKSPTNLSKITKIDFGSRVSFLERSAELRKEVSSKNVAKRIGKVKFLK